jgi:hypothetical protein
MVVCINTIHTVRTPEYVTDIDYGVLRFHGDATLKKALKTWIPTWSGGNYSYPAHIVISAATSTKHSLLFTVSADQRLRLWSLERSQFIKEYDIASSQATSGRLLPQPPAHLLALDDTHDHGEYLLYLVTYNPLEEGQFIIWGGQHHHGAFTSLVQLQSPFSPETPSGSTGIWNVSNFFLTEVKTITDSQGHIMTDMYSRVLRLWINWKSYYSSILQYTDLSSPNQQWITIMSDSTTPPESDSPELENSVEFWSDRILKPGRFSDSLLLTAFTIYQHHLLPPDLHRDLSSSRRILRRDLISGIVGCKTKLNVNPHTNVLDFDKYRQDLSLEFAQFETTCKELSKAGEELRSLTYDSKTGQVVVVRSDGVSTIRNLSVAEILLMGATGSDGLVEDISRGTMIHGSLYAEFKSQDVRFSSILLVRAAYRFRYALAENVGDVTAGLLEEVMSDSHFSCQDRLWSFYEKYLSDDTLLTTELQEVVSTLAMIPELAATIKSVLDILSTDICQDDTVLALDPLTSIWGDIVTIAVSETVLARWALLRDLALLLSWLYTTDQQSLQSPIKSSIETFWIEGLRAFKGISLLKHLSTTEISPSSTNPQSPEDQVSSSLQIMNLTDSTNNLPLRTTGLRYLIEETLNSSGVGLNYTSFPAPLALSLVVSSILTQLNFADGYSGLAIRVVARFLRVGAFVEASRFARYLPNSPVGGYVWGNVLLRKGCWEKAVVWFTRVAPILAKSGRVDDYEFVRNLAQGEGGAGKGLFNYYYHVARMFEEVHAHGESIYFCQRALGLAGEVSLTFPMCGLILAIPRGEGYVVDDDS